MESLCTSCMLYKHNCVAGPYGRSICTGCAERIKRNIAGKRQRKSAEIKKNPDAYAKGVLDSMRKEE